MRGGRTHKFKSEINAVPNIDVMLVRYIESDGPCHVTG
jgi:biopolymer transport protein ExbD